ncbi:uncharacterized protein LOC114359947 [Ostrinia furnacalis]|uniref:uncharacterized protein LOC114359947 n=1 Tax=Ostrinia furnacalis TaxID=93504 RepID=UPI0010406B5F|nr:uncharacterized protein LOC114359947 [Ostrinia furnacalis]
MLFLKTLSKIIAPHLSRFQKTQSRTCHSVFDFKELLQHEKPDQFTVHPLTSEHHQMALDAIKRHYLSEHVLVRARKMDLNDRALDEYLVSLMKQGNSLYAKAEDDAVAGVCVNFASSQVDPRNLRVYAQYRQDPNIKDFLCFTAKLQETPNLWEAFKQTKIFEIKMLTVLPEYRRQGLAVTLTERSKELAIDLGYKVIRMDCINPYDYKVAERCMLHCIVKFPLHKLRGPHAPYIKRSSELNQCVRVYVEARAQIDAPDQTKLGNKLELESLIE